MKLTQTIVYSTRKYGGDLGSILYLTVVNVIIFWDHYVGKQIFPDDFLHLYHAPTFAWYADNTLFHLRTWIPYGNLGYPASLSVQSYGFYLPLVVFKELGLRYTFQNATRIQLIHTLFAGLGAYVFFRCHLQRRLTALLGALAYMMSATFVGNQQHVDVIRGAALLPWCLVFSSTSWLNSGSVRRIAVLGLIVGLLMFGSYPGLIVAAIQTVAIYAGFQVFSLPKVATRRRYLAFLIGGWALGAIAAAVKFLPIFAHKSEIHVTGGADKVFGLLPQFLITVVMPFGNPLLGGGDITVRSLYILPVILAALPFSRRPKPLVWCGVVFVLLFGFFSPQAFAWQTIVQKIPFESLSRMKMFDYRPSLALGLAIIGCASLDRLCNEPYFSRWETLLRTFIASLLFAVIWAGAISIGLNPREINEGLLPLAIATFGILALCLVPRRFVTAILILLTGYGAYAGIRFYNEPSHRRTWQFGNPNYMTEVTGLDLQAAALPDPRRYSWPERPRRNDAIHLRSNLGYYTQEFYLHGMDSGHRLNRTLKALSLIDDPSGKWISDFLSQPSRVWVAQAGRRLSATDLQHCPNSCRTVDPDFVRMAEYRQDGATYDVSIANPLEIVENEVFYPGWTGRVCVGAACGVPFQAHEAAGVLRSWTLPAGKYRFVTVFEDPPLRIGHLLFFLGLALTVALLCPARLRVFSVSTPQV